MESQQQFLSCAHWQILVFQKEKKRTGLYFSQPLCDTILKSGQKTTSSLEQIKFPATAVSRFWILVFTYRSTSVILSCSFTPNFWLPVPLNLFQNSLGSYTKPVYQTGEKIGSLTIEIQRKINYLTISLCRVQMLSLGNLTLLFLMQHPHLESSIVKYASSQKDRASLFAEQFSCYSVPVSRKCYQTVVFVFSPVENNYFLIERRNQDQIQ